MEAVHDVLSFGDIQRATDLPAHRLRYLLETRCIRPVGTVGGLNLYSPEAVTAVKQAEQGIRDRRSGRRHR